MLAISYLFMSYKFRCGSIEIETDSFNSSPSLAHHFSSFPPSLFQRARLLFQLMLDAFTEMEYQNNIHSSSLYILPAAAVCEGEPGGWSMIDLLFYLSLACVSTNPNSAVYYRLQYDGDDDDGDVFWLWMRQWRKGATRRTRKNLLAIIFAPRLEISVSICTSFLYHWSSIKIYIAWYPIYFQHQTRPLVCFRAKEHTRREREETPRTFVSFYTQLILSDRNDSWY